MDFSKKTFLYKTLSREEKQKGWFLHNECITVLDDKHYPDLKEGKHEYQYGGVWKKYAPIA